MAKLIAHAWRTQAHALLNHCKGMAHKSWPRHCKAIVKGIAHCRYDDDDNVGDDVDVGVVDAGTMHE